jgi:hypothetical protein
VLMVDGSLDDVIPPPIPHPGVVNVPNCSYL